MVFERKEKITQEESKEIKTYFWTLLKWYWLLVPTFYFMFILPKLVQNIGGGLLSFTDISTLFFQTLNYIMVAIMVLIDPKERSRKGVADKFLKIGIFQQFFVQNIFGMIFVLLAWYQLPRTLPTKNVELEEEQTHIKPKTTLILVVIATIFSLAFGIARFFLF